MRAIVNGRGVEAKDGESVSELVERSVPPHLLSTKIAVLGRTVKAEAEVMDFVLETSRGAILVKIPPSPLKEVWVRDYRKLQGAKVGWVDDNALAFGKIDLSWASLKPFRGRTTYRRGDVFLSLGGYDASNTYLCLSKTAHEGLYGAPNINKGLIGRIVKGGEAASKLDRGDAILRVSPSEAESRSLLTLSGEEARGVGVAEGMEIYTFLEAELDGSAPQSVDHFLSTLREGAIDILEAQKSFVFGRRFTTIALPSENTGHRFEGSITVRNSGGKQGAVYLYRGEAPPVESHNVVGRVRRGLELVRGLSPKDRVVLETNPPRLIVLGMTQRQAEEYLGRAGVEQRRGGEVGDDAVVVEQEPRTTMEGWRARRIETVGVKLGEIFTVELYDSASPVASQFFRKSAGMLYAPVGRLEILEKTQGLALLAPVGVRRGLVVPLPIERTFSESAEAGDIGVTNSVKRLTGTIGLRLASSAKFSPTGEPLEATNSVGRIVGGLEGAAERRPGEVLYLVEKLSSAN